MLNLVNASGWNIAHWAKREVQVVFMFLKAGSVIKLQSVSAKAEYEILGLDEEHEEESIEVAMDDSVLLTKKTK